MSVNKPQLQRRIRFVNAWFTPLDNERRGLLQSGRLRLLLLSGLLLALLLLNFAAALMPDLALAQALRTHAAWLHVLEIALLLLLVWSIWRELLQPLSRIRARMPLARNERRSGEMNKPVRRSSSRAQSANCSSSMSRRRPAISLASA